MSAAGRCGSAAARGGGGFLEDAFRALGRAAGEELALEGGVVGVGGAGVFFAAGYWTTGLTGGWLGGDCWGFGGLAFAGGLFDAGW